MSITYRRGILEDSQSVFQVFVRSIMDYGERMNVMAITGGNDPQVLELLWKLRRPMFEYLANDATQFWVAENDGELSLMRWSIEHDGMQELTEFFVSPHQQILPVEGIVIPRV